MELDDGPARAPRRAPLHWLLGRAGIALPDPNPVAVAVSDRVPGHYRAYRIALVGLVLGLLGP